MIPRLDYNIPVILTTSQTLALKIKSSTHESDRPEYADSLFEVIRLVGAGFEVTRRKKGNPPPFRGVAMALGPLNGPQSDQEAMKVRTLSLELLSNIEDLQMAKQIPLTLEPKPGTTKQELFDIIESKGIVRYFIETVALKKKAGFVDYKKFISFIAQVCPPIFKRHLELVELQEKLPKKIKLKVSRWDDLRTLIKSGLFVKTILETAAHAIRIGLHPLPRVPCAQTIVNLYPTLDAINIVDSNHREAARWLMYQTRVVSFRELCQSIRASCQQLRETIRQWNDYYLLSVEDKSQEWMADIAYRFLPPDKLPKGVLNMSLYSVGEGLFSHLKNSDSDHFILFDDAAHSVVQFNGYLEKLFFLLMRNGPFQKRKELYFVCGLFPREEKLNATYVDFEKYNVKIIVVSNILTDSLESKMNKEKFTASQKEKIEDLASPTRPHLATEWKKPDYVSTSTFISQGDKRNFGKEDSGELHGDLYSSEKLNGVGPIEEVIPPYRRR